MTNIKHTLFVCGSGCHPASSPTLISIDSVLVRVDLRLRATFNLLVNFFVLNRVLLVFTIIFRQLSVLAVRRVWLLLLRNWLVLVKRTSWLINLLILLLLLVFCVLIVDRRILAHGLFGNRFRSDTLFFDIAIFLH